MHFCVIKFLRLLIHQKSKQIKVVKTALLKARYYSVEERQLELDESYEALFVAYTAYLKRIEDFSLEVQEEQESKGVIDLSQ